MLRLRRKTTHRRIAFPNAFDPKSQTVMFTASETHGMIRRIIILKCFAHGSILPFSPKNNRQRD